MSSEVEGEIRNFSNNSDGIMRSCGQIPQFPIHVCHPDAIDLPQKCGGSFYREKGRLNFGEHNYLSHITVFGVGRGR